MLSGGNATELPFCRLPDGGRRFLGIPALGDLTARKGYGRPVFEALGYSCAYCGQGLGSYRSWLEISVDHVLPQHLLRVGWPKEWLLDLANSVPCCRACNEFTNSYRVGEVKPATPEEFFDLRDRHFRGKQLLALSGHEGERAWHSANVPNASSIRLLLRSYKDALSELQNRGVIRSTKVLADYAEWLAAHALNLELAEGGATKGYDAIDRATGMRYQVKARHVIPPYMQPDLRGQGSLDNEPFDYLVGVLIGVDYEVLRAAIVPIALVRERAKRIKYTNGYRFHLASGVLSHPDVVDVTPKFRSAADL